MSLIVVEQASLRFGSKILFEALNLRVGEGEHIGLIGANGSGKSTLLKAMAGRQGLDGGQVRLSRNCSIGYLPQDILELQGATILASVMETVPGRTQVEHELKDAEQALASTGDPEEQLRLARVLANLHERLDRFETYFSESRAISILVGLGFRQADLSRPSAELSGGWKMRAALAGLLFLDPDVLFLDEPTNHLDVPSVAWLDGYLHQCKSSLILICHDRSFLNRHIQRVVSFEPEGVKTYAGTYDDYKAQRIQEEEVLEASARNREREIRELERFVDRFRAKATKARQAQSRAKLIEKMQKEMAKPIIRPKRMQFSFPPTPRSGKDVLYLDEVSKRFGSLTLYQQVSQGVYAGDRIAIVGVNGAGKTTLLKLMAGELTPEQGSIRFGANVEIGYYAQHHTELLDPQRSVLEEVWRLNPGAGQSYVRGVCGAFLFSGDDVDKAVGILSGGERARVLLARLLITKSNLLLMDEPTNHLDISAAEALAEALLTFDGTLVFVSHNRSFINHLATKVWDIQQGQIVEYPGNLDDYFHHLSLAADAETASATLQTATTLGPEGRPGGVKKSGEPVKHGAADAPSPKDAIRIPADDDARAGEDEGQQRRSRTREEEKERKRREAKRRNEVSRRTRQARQEIQAMEARIAQLEGEQQVLEPQLADPELYRQTDLFKATLRQYQENRQKIEELYARWEHQQEQLEHIEAELAAEEH